MIDHNEANRGSGRTIRLMLKTILAMSEQPNEWIEVVNGYPTPEARRYMMEWIGRICRDELGMYTQFRYTLGHVHVRFVK